MDNNYDNNAHETYYSQLLSDYVQYSYNNLIISDYIDGLEVILSGSVKDTWRAMMPC